MYHFSKAVLVGVLYLIFFHAPGYAVEKNDIIIYLALDGDAKNSAREEYQGKGYALEFTTDRFGNAGKALWLNNAKSFIEIDKSNELHLQNTPFTIIAWMKFNLDNPDNAAISKHQAGSFNGYGIGITQNKFVFYLNQDPRLMSQKAYNDDQWHMVAAVYDKETMRLYVDGIQDCQQAVKYTNINSSPLYIGTCDSSINRVNAVFKGCLDDIFIIGNALSPEQVLSFYNASKP